MDNYKPTEDELRQFADQNNKTIVYKPKSHSRSANGQLLYVKGIYIEVIENDKPYALLQKIKATMVANGYNKNYLKIKRL